MALINCPKCGKSISDKAIKCPHCGEYIHFKINSFKPFGFHKAWLFAPIGVVAFYFMRRYGFVPIDIYPFFDSYEDINYNMYMVISLFVAFVIAILLVTINLWRKPIKVCFYITLAAYAVLAALRYYNQFNPSDSTNQCNLAKYYCDNEDYQSAIEWFEKADNTGAFIGLGFMYANGLGVEKNLEKAFQLYQKVAYPKPYSLVYKVHGYKKMGLICMEQKKNEQAKKYLIWALKLAKSSDERRYSNDREFIISREGQLFPSAKEVEKEIRKYLKELNAH